MGRLSRLPRQGFHGLVERRGLGPAHPREGVEGFFEGSLSQCAAFPARTRRGKNPHRLSGLRAGPVRAVFRIRGFYGGAGGFAGTQPRGARGDDVARVAVAARLRMGGRHAGHGTGAGHRGQLHRHRAGAILDPLRGICGGTNPRDAREPERTGRHLLGHGDDQAAVRIAFCTSFFGAGPVERTAHRRRDTGIFDIRRARMDRLVGARICGAHFRHGAAQFR